MMPKDRQLLSHKPALINHHTELRPLYTSIVSKVVTSYPQAASTDALPAACIRDYDDPGWAVWYIPDSSLL